ncbi:MAG: type I 3-dehydroquinate dehydratase [Clostridia bacterium]|nr:type I 3-dehydroquinate dehydratase [Clostridia bacterium]
MIRNIKVKNVEFKKGRPVTCVPIQGATLSDLLKECENIASADVIEWRIDFFEEDIFTAFPKVMKACGDKPVLLTDRTVSEGGKGKLDNYRDFLSRIITELKPDMIDIEFDNPASAELIGLSKENNVTTVVSNHSFTSTMSEADLISKLNLMEEAGADIPKVAQMPQSFADVLTVLSATAKVSENNFPIITMSMGKLGKVTRLCGEVSGSALTFGSAAKASAPGQVNIDLLNTILDEMSI